MPENAQPRSRRHHTVPRFYLRRFGNARGQLLRVALPGYDRRVVSANKATVENDFYTMQIEGGELSDEFEQFLAGIENFAAGAFTKLIDEDVWPPDVNDRMAIAGWAALQYLRTPAMRRALDEMTDTTVKLQIGIEGIGGMKRALQAVEQREVTDEEVEDMWELMTDFDSYTIHTHPNHHIRMIVDELCGTIAVFMRRSWKLVRFRRQPLITSDTPVVILPYDDHPPSMGVGTVTAAGVLIPLSRHTALLMAALDGEDMTLRGNTLVARIIRQAVADHARRVIYHHPEDDPLALVQLHEPVDRELEVSDIERFKLRDGWPLPEE